MEGYNINILSNMLHTFRFGLILFPKDTKTLVESFCQVFRSVCHLCSIRGHNSNNGYVVSKFADL